MKRQMAQDRGLICFSNDWRSPLLWSHYADQHRGIALGFNLSNHAFAVEYRDTRVSCDWDLFMQDKHYALEIVRQVVCSKSKHWSYETETRVHVALDHSMAENGLYFLDFSTGLELAEIVVGPLCNLRRRDFQDLVSEFKPDVRVRKARLAFKSYDVVQQKNSKLWD